MGRSVYYANKIIIRLILIGFVSWCAIAAMYYVSGINWIKDTDSGWYWRVAQDLSGFDPAVTVGFPLIWRGLAEAFPSVSPSFLGQIVSLIAYVVMVPVIHMIFVELDISFARNATLFIAFFPFVGITYSVFPRVNSLVRLLLFVVILAYLKNWKWTFVLSVAVLPLFHRSTLPAVGLIVLIGLWERRLQWWMLIPMSLPLVTYWCAGALKHDDLLWYLGWYQTPNSVLGLPIADGLLGTLVLGYRGATADLIQGAVVLGYWFLAIFLLFSRVWQSQLVLVGLILPVILLGLMQPEEQIWAMFTYTTYLMIPLAVYLNQKSYAWLEKPGVWLILLVGSFSSQIAWAIYQVYIQN